jgi:hypothetical protein
MSTAQAGLDMQTYGFYNITHNSAADAAAGEAQLSVEVSDQGAGLVGFTFINNGPAECVITEIYFQDGSILGFASIDESLAGVDFQEEKVGNVNPKNLPGGKSINPEFIATTAFSIEPVNPEPTWGVGPGEWVKIVYSIQAAQTYADIIDELDNADLRIGIHVQSFSNGGSESFVNVPEPATMVLLGMGGLVLRKRKQ